MNSKHFTALALALALALGATLPGFAQTENPPGRLLYKTEMFTSAASGRYTPFWLVSNRYGLVPLPAGNGYMSAGLSYGGLPGGGFRWEAGVDLALAAPRYRKVFVRQLYAELRYRSLSFTLGSREEGGGLWEKSLSSGDMVFSSNARPIPKVELRLPDYAPVPKTGGRLAVKGDFSLGRSFDRDYLAWFVGDQQVYIKDILWHHKAIFFRIGSPGRLALFLELGMQHGVQWGGTSTDPAVGRQPQSPADFLRVVAGMAGSEEASEMDRSNALGNQYGSYDIRLTYKREHWALQAYHQHYFEDKSGMIFLNGRDGLWGIGLELEGRPLLQKLLVECLDTRNQSGSLHFIAFDHEAYPGIGGGADRYYNNQEYTTGLSYFNRSLGSPLLPSPEYNTDGSPGFRNIRVYAWHLGFSGRLSSPLAYRVLFTGMDSWGTPYRPFLNNRKGLSALVEIGFRPSRLPGWRFTGSLAADAGEFTGQTLGFGFGVARGNF
ncbi:MAG: capsule assembly Wzi family protein [Tannerellaceae bacterium]|jgi:hypothetical protein|nr:capsule assembly Wzi family protein [Tannerellaceae bacterium]